MSSPWLLAALTLVVVVGYEATLFLRSRRWPASTARSAHASLREEWIRAVGAQKGSEILAVQTLRNSIMSATMIASTAVLGLMGTLTLTTSSLRPSLTDILPALTPRLLMELVILALLFASLVSSMLAVRYFNHASFIGGMPVDSEARMRWEATGVSYIRRAGVFYSWGLRQLVLVVPVVAFIFHPVAGLGAALFVVAVLTSTDSVTMASR